MTNVNDNVKAATPVVEVKKESDPQEIAPADSDFQETQNKAEGKEVVEPPQTGAELLFSIYTSIAKGIHTFWQVCRIFYQFLCLLYQYPNATHIAIQATYKSLKLLYQTGLWDPLNRGKSAEAIGQSKKQTAEPGIAANCKSPSADRTVLARAKRPGTPQSGPLS